MRTCSIAPSGPKTPVKTDPVCVISLRACSTLLRRATLRPAAAMRHDQPLSTDRTQTGSPLSIPPSAVAAPLILPDGIKAVAPHADMVTPEPRKCWSAALGASPLRRPRRPKGERTPYAPSPWLARRVFRSLAATKSRESSRRRYHTPDIARLTVRCPKSGGILETLPHLRLRISQPAICYGLGCRRAKDCVTSCEEEYACD